MYGKGYEMKEKKVEYIDPFSLSDVDLDNFDINNYIWQIYRERLFNRPRKKKYWERENEYYHRVMKVLEETKTIKETLP
ncbi:MAG: hypothetical protein QXL89_08825 [Nitrososphaeria archaeon]